MNVFKHIKEQPFLSAVSVAAFTHSAWSLSVLFTGKEPEQFTAHWFAWLAPGALLSFAIDVGQLSTAYQIRSGQRNRAKYAAFFVLSLAIWFLQFLYVSHHMPALDLAPGVREEWRGLVTLLRDSSIWVLPALLPIALMLYTFSDSAPQSMAVQSEIDQGSTRSESLALMVIPEITPVEIIENIASSKIEIECSDCDWSGAYDSEQAATNALRAHQRKHKKTEVLISSNGNGLHA